MATDQSYTHKNGKRMHVINPYLLDTDKNHEFSCKHSTEFTLCVCRYAIMVYLLCFTWALGSTQ